MVKLTEFTVIVVALLSFALAQQASVSLPDGISLPTDGTIPSEALAAYSSVMNNPSSAQSYLSEASTWINALPTEVQAAAGSALAEASKTLAAVQSTKTAGSSSSAIHLSPNPFSYVFGALTIIALFAFMM